MALLHIGILHKDLLETDAEKPRRKQGAKEISVTTLVHGGIKETFRADCWKNSVEDPRSFLNYHRMDLAVQWINGESGTTNS
jgi:hypothetical protein